MEQYQDETSFVRPGLKREYIAGNAALVRAEESTEKNYPDLQMRESRAGDDVELVTVR